jgi:hypothetical protein
MLSIYQSHNLSDLFKHLALFLGQKQQNPFQALNHFSTIIGGWSLGAI